MVRPGGRVVALSHNVRVSLWPPRPQPAASPWYGAASRWVAGVGVVVCSENLATRETAEGA
eukprot:248595-Prymnesium_polylepis.1